eukprot:tig00021608_g22840.t1
MPRTTMPAALAEKIQRQVLRARAQQDRQEARAKDVHQQKITSMNAAALDARRRSTAPAAQRPPPMEPEDWIPGSPRQLTLPETPPAGAAPRTRLTINLGLPGGRGSLSGLATQQNMQLQVELERLRYIEEKLQEEEQQARAAEQERSRAATTRTVDGRSLTFEEAYRECCAKIAVLSAPAPTLLKEGTPTAGAVAGGEYAFYKFHVPNLEHHLRVEVKARQGDPNVYISTSTEKPTVSDATWRSESAGDDLLVIPTSDPHFKPGYFYFGIIGYGARETAFEITCSTARGHGQLVALHPGVPVSGQVLQGQYKYYRVRAVDVVFLKVSLEVRSGDADLFISNRTEYPTAEEYSWNSGETGSDSIVIMHADPDYADGLFHIGVYGYKDAFYRLVARLEKRRHADDPHTEAVLLAAAEARAEQAMEQSRKSAQGRLEEIRKNPLARVELEASCQEFLEEKAQRARSVRSQKAAVDAELEARGRAPRMLSAEAAFERARGRGSEKRERAAAAAAAAPEAPGARPPSPAPPPRAAASRAPPPRRRGKGGRRGERARGGAAAGGAAAGPPRPAPRPAGPTPPQPPRPAGRHPPPPATAPPGGRAALPAASAASPSRRASTAADPFALLASAGGPGARARRTSVHILREFYPEEGPLISRMLLLAAAAQDPAPGPGSSGGDGSWGPGVSPRRPLARAALERVWAHIVVAASRVHLMATALASARRARRLPPSRPSPRRASVLPHSATVPAPGPRRASDLPLRLAPPRPSPDAAPLALGRRPSAGPSAAAEGPAGAWAGPSGRGRRRGRGGARRRWRRRARTGPSASSAPRPLPRSPRTPPPRRPVAPALAAALRRPAPHRLRDAAPAPPPPEAPPRPRRQGRRARPRRGRRRRRSRRSGRGRGTWWSRTSTRRPSRRRSPPPRPRPRRPRPAPRPRRPAHARRMPGRGYVPLTKAQLEKLANVGSSTTMPPDLRFAEFITCRPKYEYKPKALGPLALGEREEAEEEAMRNQNAFYGLTVDNMLRVKKEAARLWTRAIKL